MFKFHAFAVLILSAVVATGASAASTHDASQSVTREQVRAEVLAARAAGTLDFTEANYPREYLTVSTVTRAEVMAGVIRARAAGELDVIEATNPFPNAKQKSSLTRADVLAEVIRARAAGELEITEATL